MTGKIDAFAPEAKIIHVDIDRAELGKVRAADVGIAGDCRLVIEELLAGAGAGRGRQWDGPGSRAVVDAAPPVAGAFPALLRPRRRRGDQAADGGGAAA